MMTSSCVENNNTIACDQLQWCHDEELKLGSTSINDNDNQSTIANDSSSTTTALDLARFLSLETSQTTNGGDSGDQQRSNSSSLESIIADENCNVTARPSVQVDDDGFEFMTSANKIYIKFPDDDDDATTSCSADSFEISTASSPASSSGVGTAVRQQPQPTTTTTTDDVQSIRSSCGLSEIARQTIHDELDKLDTALPQFDFDRLEQQLLTDAREMTQRKIMGEHVRRRLAAAPQSSDMMENSMTMTSSPSSDSMMQRFVKKKQQQRSSNLGYRLQTGMNLQVCFMNDAIDEDMAASSSTNFNDDDDGSGSDESFTTLVPKSHSTPNLNGTNRICQHHDVDISNASELQASEIRRLALDTMPTDSNDRRLRLETETCEMFAKAKQAAHMQMEVEKQQQRRSNSTVDSRARPLIESVVNVPLNGKFSRVKLSKLNVTPLQLIVNELHSKVEAQNIELVQLLIERDALHMEQDSMLVDIEDMIQHQKCQDIALPAFLKVEAPKTNGNNGKSIVHRRIFKR